MSIEIEPIGVLYSPFKCLENMPVQPCGGHEYQATIHIDEKYQEGLADLDGFSHIYLIYYFHKVSSFKLRVVPFNDKTKQFRGVFSTRTPMHPNSLGLSLVELVDVKKNIVTIKGVDIVDQTPIIDIKPYIPSFDQIKSSVTTGWMQSSDTEVSYMRSDTRFIDADFI